MNLWLHPIIFESSLVKFHFGCFLPSMSLVENPPSLPSPISLLPPNPPNPCPNMALPCRLRRRHRSLLFSPDRSTVDSCSVGRGRPHGLRLNQVFFLLHLAAVFPGPKGQRGKDRSDIRTCKCGMPASLLLVGKTQIVTLLSNLHSSLCEQAMAQSKTLFHTCSEQRLSPGG